MQQQILCITAGQRSGTTALRSLIAETNRFADFGEIFDTATIDLPESYYGFCRARRLQVIDVLSGPDAEKLCRDYFSVLRNKAGVRHLLFDVKFNSWSEIRMPWTFLHQEPFFLRQLKWREAKIIFVWRRNIVEQVISDRISDHIGKWHNLQPGDVKEPFPLDVGKIRNRAMLLCQSERYFYENLKEYPHALMLCYEDLFDTAGVLNPDFRGRICRLMGEEFALPKLGFYRKNDIDKSKVVANYAQLAAAIAEVASVHRDPDLAEGTAV